MSRDLVHLARDLWRWCLKKNIHLTAQHLLGVENVIANALSRNMRDRSDWLLDPAIFMQIAHRYGPIDVHGSHLTTQCPVYFSWRPDPCSAGNKCIPTGLVSFPGLCKPSLEPDREDPIRGTSRQDQDSTGIAPGWKTEPWHPQLLQLLIAEPLLIIHNQPVVQGNCPEDIIPQL